MKSKKIFYRNQAESIINKLHARKMEGHYCDNVEEAKELLVKLLGDEPKSVGYGGSMTLDNHGFKDAVSAAGHELIIREKLESKECKMKLSCADAFLMSTNAITLDGELVNIDGAGSRLAYLIYGPEKVYVIAGMNKVVTNVEDGIRRVRNIATPANTVRLGVDSPCAKTGMCANCLENTICCQFVVTRASRIKDRICVILVGEELGY